MHYLQEEGPEPLSAAEGDAEVLGGTAWTPLFSSSAEHVKYQVAGELVYARRWLHHRVTHCRICMQQTTKELMNCQSTMCLCGSANQLS